MPSDWAQMISGLAVLALIGAGAGYARERRRRRTYPIAGGLHPERSVPYTQELELYHNDFSLCSKKIRMGLAELDIPYASHHIDLIETGSYETLSRRFLAVNPAALEQQLAASGGPFITR